MLQQGETQITAAEWPDCAKGFTYCHVDLTDEMKDFAKRNPIHHAYHYNDISFQLPAYKDGEIGTAPDDVVNILEHAIRVLKGQAPANSGHELTKREAPLILAHMTGDIHQPLRVGAGQVSDDDKFIVPKDAAEAKAFFTQGGNLLIDKTKGVHSLWDARLVVNAMRASHSTTSDVFAQSLLAKAKKVKGETGDPMDWPARWATESLQLAALEISPLTVLEKRPMRPARSPCRASDSSGTGSVWDVQLPDKHATEGAGTAGDQIAKA